MKTTSLKDIANQLGVSTTLVSMVLNDRGDEKGISAETQKKVWDLAKKLNYRPNQVARSLRLGNSKTIGLIIADISNVFYSVIAKSIEEKASENGYSIMFMSSEENPEKEDEMLRVLMNKGVDGLILSTSFSDRNQIRRLRDSNIPFVLIDRYVPGVKTNYVVSGNYQGAFDMTEHLLSLGLTKTALLSVTPSHLTTMKHRISGYQEALRKNGHQVKNKLIKEIPYNNNIRENMEKALKQLILEEKIDSIFFLNNKLTIEGLNALKRFNIRIPYDISIASFDDIELFKFSYPAITSVSQPKEEIGKVAFEVLLNQINDREAKTQQIVLPVKLNIRESCGNIVKNLFTDI
ncbi:LacI family DNA-binding transcriptional regulator [Sunxiuqinia sp. A32]|uniref:LacI family DNA-binding transcriptional regulator n=1 Tax=Sunxiuqinia sp. A32 TaxID=3461496 RepID=UPI0040457388